jgi:crotonobetainyl-CoA:carnitine CoA-transferase CaiB-like acyl-CoA transferase
VFIESSRPGRLDRQGLGAVTVRDVNPRIVYCSISGYGQTGPHRDKPGHDIDYLAMSGMLSLLGPAGAPPTPPGLQLADIATGTFAATRILAALIGRSKTGYGVYLDVAAIDGPVSWLGTLGDAVGRATSTPGPMSGAYPCYGTYRASDGRYLAVGALEVPFWRAFCTGLGREDLSARQFDPAAIPLVAAAIATRPSGEWLERFTEDACVAPVRSPAEALADEYVRRRGFGPIPDGPAPGLGADTDDVLAESGIAPTVVQRLMRSGVVTGLRSAAREARAARLGAMLARHGRSDTQPTA